MKNGFKFEYVDEAKYRKEERAIRKYNMLAFRTLTFDYYPKLREGNFLGQIVSKNQKKNTVKYELKLPSDEIFSKVHGDITVHYTVNMSDNTIVFEKITPEELLEEGHRSELTTYKGVMISKTHKDKDMFKINLLNMMGR